MPIIAVVIGAIMTGLLLWFTRGGGMQQLDHILRERQDRKRREKVLEEQRLAPLRAVKDPREGATVMMIGIAQLRGVMTPEQEDAVKQEMRTVLELSETEAAQRFIVARHAATQAASIDKIIDDLARLFQEKLTREERHDLAGMLDRVAALHGGPTMEQERAIALANRRFAEAV